MAELLDPKVTFPIISVGPKRSPVVLFGNTKLPLTVPPASACDFQKGIPASGKKAIGAPSRTSPEIIIPASSVSPVEVAFPFMFRLDPPPEIPMSLFERTSPLTVT